MKNKLIIVDGCSIMFRAYYATIKSNQQLRTTTGIPTNALLGFINLMEKILDKQTHAVVVFDGEKPTFRHQLYTDYKAGRADFPADLGIQEPLLKEYLKYKGVNVINADGVEADDLIGTVATKEANNFNIQIFSSDRDLLQLVSDDVMVTLLKSGLKEVVSYTKDSFKEEYGITVEQYLDYKVLIGDSSDNIKGISMIGPKTAVKLLNEFNNIEGIYHNLDKLKESQRDTFILEKDKLAIAQQLVAIITDADMSSYSLDYKINQDTKNLYEFYEKYEIKGYQASLKYTKVSNIEVDYEEIVSDEQLSKILVDDSIIYFNLDGINYHRASILGIGIGIKDKIYYIDPLYALNSDIFKAYLSNDTYKKYLFDSKKVYVLLSRYGVVIKNVFFDIILGSYLISTKIKSNTIEDIISYFNIEQVNTLDSSILGITSVKVYYLSQLIPIIEKKITEFDLDSLFKEVEIPLAFELSQMEIKGVLIDQNQTDFLNQEFMKKIDEVTNQIYLLAGETFNLNSPNQVGDILFKKLQIPNSKKTKHGFSTSVDVLQELSYDYEIISLILDYRKYFKLKSTYINGINEFKSLDNKIHTIFLQALTQTGRLSSIEPNLQNIPVRDNVGKLIRKMFISSPGYSFISCDYSQIELRVLADVANVVNLKESFNQNKDVHEETGRLLFPDYDVKEARSKAKAIVFGTIYGQEAFNLSKELKVGLKEAKEYINNFFDLYPEIRTFKENIIQFAKDNGYVTTILKRRRYIPEITSSSKMEYHFGERLCINTPIQGSAADIIKLAIIKLGRYLRDNNLKSNIILQIHDELIVEAKDDEVEILKEIIPNIMSSAYKLSVNLKTSCDVAKNWYELK